jgi:crotonobetainyl-CoA:carnitine CoA-transferase CaiB-like acyl-CoA transferase
MRAQKQSALCELLEENFADQSVAALDAFTVVGVPCDPVNSYANALADPQVEHMGWVREVDLPGRLVKTSGSPIMMSGQGYPTGPAGAWRVFDEKYRLRLEASDEG